MTNNLINGAGGTSGACRISVSSVLLVIIIICIQVRASTLNPSNRQIMIESQFTSLEFNHIALI